MIVPLTTAETVKTLRIHITTLYRWLAKGKVGAYKQGQRWWILFKRTDIEGDLPVYRPLDPVEARNVLSKYQTLTPYEIVEVLKRHKKEE